MSRNLSIKLVLFTVLIVAVLFGVLNLFDDTTKTNREEHTKTKRAKKEYITNADPSVGTIKHPDGLVVTVVVRTGNDEYIANVTAKNTGNKTLEFIGNDGCARYNVDVINEIKSNDFIRVCTQAIITDTLEPGDVMSSGEIVIPQAVVDGKCLELEGYFYQFESGKAKACF